MIPANPEELRAQLPAAMQIADHAERAARLYFLGSLLCAAEDERFHADGFEALRAAAQAGSTHAAFEMGMMLASGRSVEASRVGAVAMLRKAAEGGHADAALHLARLLLEDPARRSEGIEWLQKSAASGTAEARHLLGLAHLHGLGVPKDFAEARRLQAEAANSGVAEAQLELALMLRQGIGGPGDLRAADEWERRAADAGEGRACLNMAVYAATASPPRITEMRTWYERAATAGNAEAAARLAILFQGGGQLEADEEESKRWFLRAAELGYDWTKRLETL